jgi:hypothetical protein
MSTVVYCVVGGIVALYTVLGVCIHRINRRRPLERDQIIAAARDSYVGPDSLRLMQDLDAHLDAYAARVAGLYEPAYTAPDPVLAAGCERLWDAVRDEQNHHKGDK